jgi:hypothetical protein
MDNKIMIVDEQTGRIMDGVVILTDYKPSKPKKMKNRGCIQLKHKLH